MSIYIAAVSKQREVTIPIEVQEAFGLDTIERVAFEVIGNKVTVKPVERSLESVYGAVAPLNRPEDLDEIARIAKDDRVERALHDLRGE